MKLYVGMDNYKERGYFLVHCKDGRNYYYNKITKDFQAKSLVVGLNTDMYYIDFKTLVSLLNRFAEYDTVKIISDMHDDQLRDFVATLNFMPLKESQAATDSFELYGAL